MLLIMTEEGGNTSRLSRSCFWVLLETQQLYLTEVQKDEVKDQSCFIFFFLCLGLEDKIRTSYLSKTHYFNQTQSSIYTCLNIFMII